MRSHP